MMAPKGMQCVKEMQLGVLICITEKFVDAAKLTFPNICICQWKKDNVGNCCCNI